MTEWKEVEAKEIAEHRYFKNLYDMSYGKVPIGLEYMGHKVLRVLIEVESKPTCVKCNGSGKYECTSPGGAHHWDVDCDCKVKS